MNKLIKTYLGFCIKSRVIVIGQDRLKANKGKIYLIIYCNSASQNLKDLAKRMADKYNCKAICLDTTLQDYTNLDGCKIVGLTNMSLAEAILKVAENQDKGENNGK